MITAVFDADVGGCERYGLIQRNYPAHERLRREAVSNGLTAVLGEVFVHLEDHDRGNKDSGIAL